MEANDVKMVAVILGGVLLLAGLVATAIEYDNQIDARSPVVESCVKHPATRSPFRGQ